MTSRITTFWGSRFGTTALNKSSNVLTAMALALCLLTGSANANSVDLDVVTHIVDSGCGQVNINVNRTTATEALALEVTFELSAELALCNDDPNADVTAGSWLGANPLMAPVLDNGGGSYTAAIVINAPCGQSGSGTAFSIHIKAASFGADGTVTIVSADLRDCSNTTIPTTIGSPATVNITTVPADPIHLTATQRRAGNDDDGTTGIRLDFVVPADAVGLYYNFQPSDAIVPTGYTPDYGLSIGLGSVGWNSVVQVVKRENTPNVAEDTFARIDNALPATWEVEVANGSYDVSVTCGDFNTSATHTIVVEGVTLMDAVHTSGGSFTTESATVAVNDGRLTMVAGASGGIVPAGSHTKVNAIHITGIGASGAIVEIYRAGFGNYPEYDDAPSAGSEPTTPISYPPGVEWTLTSVTAPGGIDEVTDRDFYYYVGYVIKNGVPSDPSNKTTGTLNYHLGDVTDGIILGAGDNLVNVFDFSLFGFYYGDAITAGDPVNFLDFAPTSTGLADGRPLTDNVIDFEELLLIGLNLVGPVSKPDTPLPLAATLNRLSLGAMTAEEGRIKVPLLAWGDGSLQAASSQLEWDPSVVKPRSVHAGQMLDSQKGVVLMGAPGLVDFALLGTRDVALSGQGVLAHVDFEVLAEGDPRIKIVAVDGRDSRNQRISVEIDADDEFADGRVPGRTVVLSNHPNPFNPTTTVEFAVVQRGRVDLGVYSVDGRLVRSLVSGTLDPGLHEVIWDGRDSANRQAASGVYYLRLRAQEIERTRPITLLK